MSALSWCGRAPSKNRREVVKDCDSGDRPGAVDGHERHGST